LQFRHPVDQHELARDEWEESYAHLTWSVVLSDGRTRIPLRDNGVNIAVRYEERYQYAQDAITARYQESALAMNAIRQGLYGIVPRQALALLTWRELEMRVCGMPKLDLAVLKRHTVYAPKRFSEADMSVKNFWRVMASLSEDDQARFLQFAWARSRLPYDADAGGGGTGGASGSSNYRMQLSILEYKDPLASEALLPTSETCFFNVRISRSLLENEQLLRAKLLFAINNCQNITH